MKNYTRSHHRFLSLSGLRASLFVTLLTTASLVFAQSHPQPTLFYDFNNPSGATISSVNSTQNLDFNSYGYPYTVTPSFTADGGGVSEQSGDRALDLSSATGMGGGGENSGGGAVSTANLSTVPGFSGAVSFTLAGWFYTTESSIATNAHLMNLSDGNNGGFRLSGQGTESNAGNLRLEYVGENGRDTFTSTNNPYAAVGEWVFFAVTVDSTITDPEVDNVFFYHVDANGDLVVTNSLHSGLGALQMTNRNLVFGNAALSGATPSTTRPFQGYLDNFGLWVDDEGAGAALSLAELNVFRLSQIPETGHFSAAAGFLILAFWGYRRFRRSATR